MNVSGIGAVLVETGVDAGAIASVQPGGGGFRATYSEKSPLAERANATYCRVLLSTNWPTTVPSSLTPCTMLREYPEGAEKVSKVQEAV